MNKRERVRDFSERAAADPGAVRDTGDLGRYLSVNPMADEKELLAGLSIEPSACTKVDLYWEHEGDVKFVQIQTEDYAAPRKPGIYARKAPSGRVNVVVVVREPMVSSEVVHAALATASRTRIAEARLGHELERL
jgi:hypothetical protein